MKTILLAFILFFGNLIYAQTFEFNFTYTFKKDSVSKRNFTEIMTVFSNEHSRFYRSQSKILSDSVGYTKNKIFTDANTLITTTESYISSVDNTTIEIDLNSKIQQNWIFTYDRAVVSSEELNLPIWNLSDERVMYNNLKLKKATTYFLGRNWTAYYTEEIPVQIAPYNFYGLPGTIVKLEDSNSLFKFELLNYKPKVHLDNFYSTSINFRRKKDFEKITSKEMYEYGKFLIQNSAQNLINSGVQLSEEQVKKIENNIKNRKYIFLDPTIPFVI